MQRFCVFWPVGCSFQASFPLMSQTFGLCMLFSAWLLYTSTNAGKEVIVENVESSTHSPTLKHLKPATRCLQNRGDAEDGVGSFGAPIYMSQAFLYQGPGQPYPKGSIYGRFGHPTRTKLEEGLAALHLVKHALTFSSYEAWVLDELVWIWKIQCSEMTLWIARRYGSVVIHAAQRQGCWKNRIVLASTC